MSDLSSILNSIATIKETRPLKSLQINLRHEILKMRRVKTAFGVRILAELADCVIFLGERFCILTDEQLATYNILAERGSLHIISHGPVGSSRATNLSFEIDEEFAQEF